MTAFKRSVARSPLNMPQGQATHILRHTFASSFVMNGGSILSLKEILGHADIKMTMKYAHLAADHSIDVVRLNPMAGGSKIGG